MSTRSILLAYATRYSSTQEVAEAIAAALRESGLDVDRRPMQDVKTVDNYEAVVLGAAIYNARWHPDTHRFLTQHQAILRQRPVAIFALGPLSVSATAKRNSRRQLDVAISTDQRAPILRRYLQAAPGARPHVPVDKDAPLAEFERIAAAFPVFCLGPSQTQ